MVKHTVYNIQLILTHELNKLNHVAKVKTNNIAESEAP